MQLAGPDATTTSASSPPEVEEGASRPRTSGNPPGSRPRILAALALVSPEGPAAAAVTAASSSLDNSERTLIPPLQGAAGGVSAVSNATYATSAPASNAAGEPAAARHALLVSRGSDAAMVARAIGWEVMRHDSGSVAGQARRKAARLAGAAAVAAAAAGAVGGRTHFQGGESVAAGPTQPPTTRSAATTSAAAEPHQVDRAQPPSLTERISSVAALEDVAATLRMGFGDALLTGVAAVAMAQGRVAEELKGVQVVAVPRSVRVREGGRTFNVAEWDLLCSPPPSAPPAGGT